MMAEAAHAWRRSRYSSAAVTRSPRSSESFPGRGHGQLPVLDAFHADQRVGDFPDLTALSLHDQHLQAMIMIEMDVHPGHDVPLEIMLDVGQLSCQIRHVVVIDE